MLKIFGRSLGDIFSGQSEGTARRSQFWQCPVQPETSVDVELGKQYRRSEMPKGAGPLPWLDRGDAEDQIEHYLRSGEISSDEAELCRKWARDGYVILKNFYNADELDRSWDEYETHIVDGRVKPPVENFFEGDELPGRVLDGHFAVDALDRMLFEPRINKIISILLGAQSRPFQTIVGHKSSQQLEHSDSIHMTTYPEGYLAATWVAFEDVDLGAGPLTYYPGSHKLPYMLADEVGLNRGGTGYDEYHSKYEPAVQAAIQDNDLRVQYFVPKKGDVLIWHANLLHGGSKILSHGRSRKALVCHYFAQGCICYHDLTGGLARIHAGDGPYQYDRSVAR